jgi:hypothetical protein
MITCCRVKVERMTNDKSCKSSQVILIDGIVYIYSHTSSKGMMSLGEAPW